jgi:hypothetical protein
LTLTCTQPTPADCTANNFDDVCTPALYGQEVTVTHSNCPVGGCATVTTQKTCRDPNIIRCKIRFHDSRYNDRPCTDKYHIYPNKEENDDRILHENRRFSDEFDIEINRPIYFFRFKDPDSGYAYSIEFKDFQELKNTYTNSTMYINVYINRDDNQLRLSSSDAYSSTDSDQIFNKNSANIRKVLKQVPWLLRFEDVYINQIRTDGFRTYYCYHGNAHIHEPYYGNSVYLLNNFKVCGHQETHYKSGLLYKYDTDYKTSKISEFNRVYLVEKVGIFTGHDQRVVPQYWETDMYVI